MISGDRDNVSGNRNTISGDMNMIRQTGTELEETWI